MSFPLDELLSPTRNQLYNDLYLDYFVKKTKDSFPSVLSSVDGFVVLIRLMGWALARSYQQPTILKYIYDPDLVMGVLLPKLADTLNFSYPVNYPVEQLRLLIKYLQAIRRNRGTWDSVKQLIRLLEVDEKDIYSMSFTDYNSVFVEENDEGFVLIQYNNIKDEEFTNEMLRMVMPAGYDWRLESGLIEGDSHFVKRNRVDFAHASENLRMWVNDIHKESCSIGEFVKILKISKEGDTLFEIEESSLNGFN